jgi:hypothetical protein
MSLPYRVPTHEISTTSPQEEITIARLQQSNESRKTKAPILPPSAETQRIRDPQRIKSVTVFTDDPHAVDECIKPRFYINHLKYGALRYAPQCQLTQIRHRAEMKDYINLTFYLVSLDIFIIVILLKPFKSNFSSSILHKHRQPLLLIILERIHQINELMKSELAHSTPGKYIFSAVVSRKILR